MTSESSQPGAAQPAEDLRPSGPFRLGDRVQLTGPKGRMHTVTLREHGELQQGKTRNTMAVRRVDDGHIAAGFKSGQAAELHRGVAGMPSQERLT